MISIVNIMKMGELTVSIVKCLGYLAFWMAIGVLILVF